MLETYANFLKNLNEASPNDLPERVALRLRFSVKPQEVEHCTRDVRDLILAMPNLSEKIHSWLKAPYLSLEDKRRVSDLTRYLHHPLDVIPYRQTLFDYLADAYMTGYVFKRIFEIIEAIQHSASEEVAQWRDHLPIWLSHAKKVIPYEARKMERMVDEIINSQKGGSPQERLESVINTFRRDKNYTPPLSGQYAAA